MPATIEVASDLDIPVTTITTVNAGVFVAQALSGLIWLPISTIIGRRSAYLAANIVLCLCAIGCATAPNLAGFASLWILGGSTGPFFLVAGQTILADIFDPTVRGTAVGFFLGSCVSANSIAPLLGSVIATFTSWRVIYGVEAGMCLFGFILSFLFIPRASEVENPKLIQPRPRTKDEVLQTFNPMHVFCQFAYPKVILANIACGLLGFNQYGLLSSVRRVINPRFNLTSPLSSGLFYLAPGAGFLAGSTVGGKISDVVVKRYIKKRNGERRPEDRLNSSLPSILIILPLGTLLYGWSVQQKVGGMPLPVVSAFIEGFGLMAAFSGLNTYAAEVRPAHRTAVITGKYVVQYSFGAMSVGGVVPMIDSIGVGWAFTKPLPFVHQIYVHEFTMHLSLSQHLLLLSVYLTLALAQGVAGSDPYVPVYTECPSDLKIRPAKDGLSDEESSWRERRAKKMMPNLEDYLKLVNISDFDIKEYMDKLKEDDVPVVGMSVSGGGTQSGLGGLGIWRAFDARSKEAVAARTGGLTQLLSYITGLSGGGAVTVSLLAANNFTTLENIEKNTNFSNSYAAGPDGNQTSFFNDIFENAGAKDEAGFPVSVADTFGQFWGTWLPEDMLFSNYSDIANNDTAFGMGDAPMPILCFAEVVPGKSPEIGKLTYPTLNTSNLFNCTAYEVTPYEFGSWAGGRVQAFISTKYLGTSMSDGKPQNKSQCVEGFDKLTLMQGTTTNAFTAWFIDTFYNIPIFAKRWLERRQQVNPDINDIPIPSDQDDNPLVQLVNQTATYFDLTFNQSLWATYPNPFEDYNKDMDGVSELLLIDGSLALESNPLRPLITPDRKLDFIIVYEASSDAPNSWNNGSNLINTARAASQGDIPFPKIPDVNTIVAQNLSFQPTFFGCNASEDTPLLLWLPNAPWTGYTNYSYTQAEFTSAQLNIAFENAFQIATYGNGSVDENWPACLACASIEGSLRRIDMDLPKQCDECFSRHCWNGTTSSKKATAADFDLKPRLEPNLTFKEWNDTDWSSEQKNGGSSGSGSEDDSAGVRMDGSVIGLVLSVVAMVYLL
ncbi:acyl transferase/acyl hydrolase/lysophospholipase [Fusarium flagelliforme]|uniref:acyl transferase/acyl hydrolase/lysophospholipase n=1 Tax=Fusarium flagelliforme TaxID=2675880 RepID=UPI001E8DF8B0|nr:acyl transferase/acyl hydrolase/lysophospholipase [Fusarium flagelliforme]KAH7185207.1 acyl transferase/acyl hydrolase/lysophospholipase [Fusarium flagelliforme]